MLYKIVLLSILNMLYTGIVINLFNLFIFSMRRQTKMLLALAVVLAPVAATVGQFFVTTSEAAIVTVTPTNSQLVVGGGEVTFTYTSTSAVEAVGTTYTVIVSPSLPGALSNCTVADVQADATAGGDGAFGSFTTGGAIFTTTTATTTTARSFCINFPAETNPDSYSVMITSSTGDYGLAMVHYANNNVVDVSATVGASLSFNIVTLADDADTNLCQLGNVTTLTAVNLDTTDDGVGECGYGLAVGTNAGNGFTVQTIGSTNGLYNGTHTMSNVAGTYDTGTEEYGYANVTAPTTGGTAAVAGGFSGATGYAIPTVATTIVSATTPFTYTSGVANTDITRIMHGLTVGSGTPVGAYTQSVTYTATANF